MNYLYECVNISISIDKVETHMNQNLSVVKSLSPLFGSMVPTLFQFLGLSCNTPEKLSSIKI